MLTLNDETFAAHVTANAGKSAVCVTGAHCPHCRAFAPTFEAAIDAASKAELPLFCYEDEDKLFLKTAIESRGEIKTASVVTGPEGGFEPAEAEYAKSRGMMSVTMGPRILRCETAPMCALAAVMYSTNNL